MSFRGILILTLKAVACIIKRMRQTRQQIVNERPSVNDISFPRDLYIFPYWVFSPYRKLLRVLVGLWYIFNWKRYSIEEKEALKNEYFSYFWYRKYKLKK